MAPLLTVEQFRDGASVDAPDHVLQDLIDEADEAITLRFGPHPVAGQTIISTLKGGESKVFLKTPIDIAATPAPVITEDGTLLTADDYRVWYDGRVIDRWEGTWGDVVVIQYVSVANRMQRKGAAIRLVKLALVFSGYKLEKLGDVELTPHDYGKSRREILRSLTSDMGAMA